MNVASPAAALTWWRLPAEGIDPQRMEFIVMNAIKVHPMALVRYDDLQDERAKRPKIVELTRAFPSRRGILHRYPGPGHRPSPPPSGRAGGGAHERLQDQSTPN